MKILILAFALISPLARALPVLNENAVTNGSLITLWPDHKEKNVFYYAPSSYETLTEADHAFMTAYPGSKVFAVHKAVYHPELQDAVLALKSVNPDAVIKPVELKKAHVKESPLFAEVITKQKCTILPDHGNGACLLTIDESRFHEFSAFIETTGIMLQVEYKIKGVIRSGKKSIMATATYGIPLMIKGLVNDLTVL